MGGGELIHRELGVSGGIARVVGVAGLQVHDARGVAAMLHAVGAAREDGTIDGYLETLLELDGVHRVRHEVAREPVDHRLGLRAQHAARQGVVARDLVPALLERRVQGGPVAVGVELRDLVHQGAQLLLVAVEAHSSGALERPPERAALDALDARGRHPHRGVLGEEPLRRRGRGDAVPCPRIRARHARRGQPRESRRVARSLLARRGRTLGTQGRHRVAQVGHARHGAGVATRHGRGGLEPVDVAGGAGVLVLDRRHHHRAPGPRQRHDEGTGLIVQDGLARRCREGRPPVGVERLGLGPEREDVGQMLGTEHGVAQAHVGPHTFLDARHHDHVPFAACGRGRRRERHRVASRGACAERVDRELLRGQVRRESRGRGAAHALLDVLSLAQQRDDGIEVGVVARGAGQRRRAPRLRDLQRLPQHPQQAARRVLAVARGGRGASHRGAGLACRPRLLTGEARQARRVLHRLGEQVSGGRVSAASAVLADQGAPQPSERHRIEAHQARREHLRRVLLRPLALAHRDEHHGQQGRDHRLLVERHAVAQRLARDLGREQVRVQRPQLPIGARDDGHATPRGSAAVHAVMGPAQRGRDRARLGVAVRGHQNLDGAVALA